MDDVKGFIRRCIAVVMVALVLSTSRVRAQAEEAFGSVSLGLVGAFDVARGTFQDHWGRRPAVGATVRMPFYVGDVEVGLLYSRYGSDAAFTSLLGFAGWGATLPLGKVGGLTGMVVAGDYFMLFHGPQPGYSSRENEVALGASAMMEFRPVGPFGFEVGLRALRIFTSTPIDLVHVSAGLRYRLSAPEWLPAVMR